MIRIILFTICCMIGAMHLNAQIGYDLPKGKSIEVAAVDLVICEDEILANVDGVLYSVTFLERKDGYWAATIAANYCPRGHPLCGICKLCHLPGCWYYIDPRTVH